MAEPTCDICRWFDHFICKCSQDNERDIENYCVFYEEEE